ncbi:MAG: hypothetical protein ACFCGT_16430 [Sandaracinaceae bacterium]
MAPVPPPGRRLGPSPLRRTWLLLPLLAGIELVGLATVRARVPAEADWRGAAERVREAWRPGDAVVVAPSWAGPLLRHHLGDLLTPSDVGRSDLAGVERLWALSIRGHRPEEAPPSSPAVNQAFGRVRVLRWDLPVERVVYDFLAHVEDARVTLERGGEERDCPWRAHRSARGGGLGAGALVPGARFDCGRPALWVGLTTQETLDLEPRRCIHQRPADPGALRVTFPDVPLGGRLVLYGGLYSEDERDLEGAPTTTVVRVDGREIGRLVRHDGDGWARMEAITPGGRADVTVEVSSPNVARRSFCWAATTRPAEAR